MRGASALGTLLAAHPRANVRVLVVWLPVIASDKGPPADEVRAPLRDPRVIEFWDPKRWASPKMMERFTTPDFAPDQVAWDLIGLYPAGAVWEDPFPAPSWHDGPVVRALEPVERFLSDQAGAKPLSH